MKTRVHRGKKKHLLELPPMTRVELPPPKEVPPKKEKTPLKDVTKDKIPQKKENTPQKKRKLSLDDEWTFQDDSSSSSEEKSLVDKLQDLMGDSALVHQLEKTLHYISEQKVTATKILTAELLEEDRAELLQRFEAIDVLPQPSIDHLEASKALAAELVKMTRKYQEFQTLPEAVRAGYAAEKERLLQMNTSLPIDYQIVALDADDKIKATIFREYQRLKILGTADDEKPKLERWIETCLSLPFRRVAQLPDNRTVFLRQMKETLDRELYGLQHVKEQLMVFANARLSNPEMKECTLGLIGPPGTGKTAIAHLLSTCLKLPFSQISCGGITEPDILKGYSYTYIGSRPGEIVNSMIEMGCNNGVIFLDEFEKISGNQAISSLLLHILDPVQNSRYTDSYLGKSIQINLSGVWFVLSMNENPNDTALSDRIFTVRIDGYTSAEKFEIARRHLIPKTFTNMKVDPSSIIIPDQTLSHLIERVSKSDKKGVRALKHSLREIITKVHFLQKIDMPVSFTLKNLTTPYVVQSSDLDRLMTMPPDPPHLSFYG